MTLKISVPVRLDFIPMSLDYTGRHPIGVQSSPIWLWALHSRSAGRVHCMHYMQLLYTSGSYWVREYFIHFVVNTGFYNIYLSEVGGLTPQKGWRPSWMKSKNSSCVGSTVEPCFVTITDFCFVREQTVTCLWRSDHWPHQWLLTTDH